MSLDSAPTRSGPGAPAPGALAAFGRGLRGAMVLPGDSAYDAGRCVANSAIDRRPAAIVRPVDAGEVARTVAFARDAGLPLAVRAGGHSLAGHSVGTADGALVLDLAALKGITVDPARGVAAAEGGVLAGEYVKATFAHGVTTPLGDTKTVGLGGLTLGGGVGWLARRHGLTIDDLLAVEVVTADGQLRQASAEENPDLFWAVRGGGGNFGVVTRFEYRTHPIGTVLGGALVLPGTRDVVRSHVSIAASASDDMTTIAMLMAAPPVPFVPPEHHGSLAFIVMLVHDGEIERGQAAIAPYRTVARPLGEMVAPMPYPAIYELGGPEGPSGVVTRSLFLAALDDAAVDAILDAMEHRSSPRAMVQVRVLGGAMARIPADATAFAFRDRPLMVAITVPYHEPAEAPAHRAWADGLLAALRPAVAGVYSNFLDDEGPERVHEAYPGLTYHKLAQVKRRFDPDNLFRANHNIPPAA